eukprot:scaffold90850_cov69-Phaeocystis_antarctica.AAC.6
MVEPPAIAAEGAALGISGQRLRGSDWGSELGAAGHRHVRPHDDNGGCRCAPGLSSHPRRRQRVIEAVEEEVTSHGVQSLFGVSRRAD